MNPDFVIIGHLIEGSDMALRVAEIASRNNLNYIVVENIEKAKEFDCKVNIDVNSLPPYTPLVSIETINTINTDVTMVIRNYRIPELTPIQKSGKELRRERRKKRK